MIYDERNNFGLKSESYYVTLGVGIPVEKRALIDKLAKEIEIKRGQLLRKWILERLDKEKVRLILGD